MTKAKREWRWCPECGKYYIGYPAISRKDNKTQICPDCGTMQAMTEAGLSEEVKRQVMATIHSAMHEQR